MDPRVEVVVCNYRRPDKIAPIIKAFRAQSIRPKITIVNARFRRNIALTTEFMAEADEVYTFRENRGGWTRFTPLWNFDREFTYFHDENERLFQDKPTRIGGLAWRDIVAVRS